MGIRNRKNLKEELLNRTEESTQTADDSGKFASIFRKGLGNFKKWKCTEGEHELDILAWEVGTQYPTKNYPNVKPGSLAYVLDLWVHYNIGPTQDSYVCPAMNYGQPCPVCEHVNELRKREVPDDKLIDSIKAKRRSIYIVWVHDSDKEEKLGPQVWDVAHFFMEKELSERAKKPRGGGYIAFADPDDGKTVFFKRKGMGQTNTEYIGHQFLDREEKLPDEIVDHGISLDETIHIPSYSELYKAHWGKDPEDSCGITPEGEEDTPHVETHRRTPPPEEEPTKKEEPPKEEASQRRARRTTSEPESEKSSINKCPGGGVFGKDTDPLSHCNNCEIWDDCAVEAERLKQQPPETENGNTTSRRARR